MKYLQVTTINQVRTYLINLQYFIILSIALILPYWELFRYFKSLTILLIIISILTKTLDLKGIFKNKVFISLSFFIIFTYLSIIWTTSNPAITLEYTMNFNRFKYYFLLIIAIYSTSLNNQQIKKVFFTMAIAPIGIVAIYYLNALNITNIYSANFFQGNTDLITHYLINNFFILYSVIYFFILSFNNFIMKNYKQSFLFFLIVSIFFISMLVGILSTSRLIILVIIIVIIIAPIFYQKNKYILSLVFISIFLASIFIGTNTKMQNGIQTFQKALKEQKYTGSWGHRLGFAIVGIEIFKENPIIGRGISDVRERTILFAKNNPKYFIKDHNRHFHNEHINILVQVGIVGYLLFIIFLVLFLLIPIDDIFLNRLKYTFTFAFILLMFGEHYLSIVTTSSFFSLFIALILLYNKSSKL